MIGKYDERIANFVSIEILSDLKANLSSEKDLSRSPLSL